MVVWGQEFKSLKKWSDLMSIKVTVTNSGKISLQVLIMKILIFTLAASRLCSKVTFFTKAVMHGLNSLLVTQKTQN